MTPEDWTDAAHRAMEAEIERTATGAVRFRRSNPDEILADLTAYPIQNEAPEHAWSALTEFAERAVHRAVEQQEAEAHSWPERTDCDRLDEAQAALQHAGIVFWQGAPCCHTRSASL